MTDVNRAKSLTLPVVLLAGLAIFPYFAHADTLVSSTGQPLGLFNNNPEGVAWSVAGSYVDVSVSALISSGSASLSGAGTLYLTNSTGPGTSTANVIAETTLSDLAYEPTTDTSLFSGLTLGPGTYYLISSSNLGLGGIVWEGLSNPTLTTAPGSTFNGEIFSFDTNAFAPADTFNPLIGPTFGFSVTGTPAGTAVTPEPSSFALLGTGLLGLMAAAKRRLA